MLKRIKFNGSKQAIKFLEDVKKNGFTISTVFNAILRKIQYNKILKTDYIKEKSIKDIQITNANLHSIKVDAAINDVCMSTIVENKIRSFQIMLLSGSVEMTDFIMS